MNKNPQPSDKDYNASQLATVCFNRLSGSLQNVLKVKLTQEGFIPALNGLKLDNDTKQTLLNEVRRCQPLLPDKDVNESVAHREFRRCVNVLRMVGKEVLAEICMIDVTEIPKGQDKIVLKKKRKLDQQEEGPSKIPRTS